MIELGAAAAPADWKPPAPVLAEFAPVLCVAVVSDCVLPAGVVLVVVVRDDSLPESSPRSVSAMRVA